MNVAPTPAPPRIAFVMHVMQVAGAEVLVHEIIHRLAGRIEPVVLCLDSKARIAITRWRPMAAMKLARST